MPVLVRYYYTCTFCDETCETLNDNHFHGFETTCFQKCYCCEICGEIQLDLREIFNHIENDHPEPNENPPKQNPPNESDDSEDESD